MLAAGASAGRIGPTKDAVPDVPTGAAAVAATLACELSGGEGAAELAAGLGAERMVGSRTVLQLVDGVNAK